MFSAVSTVVTNSAVADVIAVCFPWFPAVEIVSAAAGGPASVVVLTAVAFVSAVAAGPTAVDILSATGVSNVSGVPAIAGVPMLLLDSIRWLRSQMSLYCCQPFAESTVVLPVIVLEFPLWRPYCC